MLTAQERIERAEEALAEATKAAAAQDERVAKAYTDIAYAWLSIEHQGRTIPNWKNPPEAR